MVRATADLLSHVPPHLISDKGLDSKSSSTFPKRSVTKHLEASTLEEQTSTRDQFSHLFMGWITSKEPGQP